jgi:hypothetical protein
VGSGWYRAVSRGVTVFKRQLPSAIFKVAVETKLQMLIFLQMQIGQNKGQEEYTPESLVLKLISAFFSYQAGWLVHPSSIPSSP